MREAFERACEPQPIAFGELRFGDAEIGKRISPPPHVVTDGVGHEADREKEMEKARQKEKEEQEKNKRKE